MSGPEIRVGTLGGLTLDRVVRPGRTPDEVAGGNALYAALGAWLYGATPTLVSFAGYDYPQTMIDRLERGGLDVSLVARLEVPSIRLDIVYRDDGSRQIHYRSGSSHLAVMEQAIDRAATAVQRLGWDGLHIGALPVRLQRPALERLHSPGSVVTLDSIEAAGNVGGDLDAYLAGDMLRQVATFLPSEAEFDAIRADRPVRQTLDAMRTAGLRRLVVKRGGRGVDVYDLEAEVRTRVGAAPVATVADPTGAGDVFCGAYLAALLGGRDPIGAAVAGAAAASCVVQEVGGIHLLQVSRSMLRRRESEILVDNDKEYA